LKCRHCDGQLVESTTDFEGKRQNRTIVIKDLSCLRCSACNYELFSPEAANFVYDVLHANTAEEHGLPEVLTVEEAAAYLRLSPQTVYSLQKTGDLPGARIGGQLRFLSSALRELFRSEQAQPSAAALRGTPTEADKKALR
jgi:excisionase family DNA binding protein/YgiT-type zinc finger domain-containing protein